MDGASDQFLAGAALASDEHAGLPELLQAFHIGEDALEVGAAADEPGDPPSFRLVGSEIG
jgi:hypothetical protein